MNVNFNKVADCYDFGEKFFFGNLLQFSRIHFIEYYNNAKSVLLLGEGCGQFLNQLLKVNKLCETTVLDSSSKMVEKQMKNIRSKDLDRVTFKCLPIEAFTSNQSFDLICSHFFWDCFSHQELLDILPMYTKILCKDGFWINSDFIDDKSDFNLNFLKIRTMYWFFRLTTGINSRCIESFYKQAVKNSLKLVDYYEIEQKFLKSEVFIKF